MKHIFPFQRNFLKAVRPIANRVAPFDLPTDRYFVNIRELFEKLEGVDEVMEDAEITSVRLVTNPEKMVLRETERAFVYFSLHGLTVDGSSSTACSHMQSPTLGSTSGTLLKIGFCMKSRNTLRRFR